MSLADALERAASALAEHGDAIRPANGDPQRLLETLAPDAAAAVLAWLLDHEPDAADELADAWAEQAGGVEPISRIDERALSKPARKILRRARHRLRSRGVAIEAPGAEPTVARLPQIEDRLEGAYVTAIDPAGARMVHWIEPNPGGGARIFEILLDAHRGVVDFEVYGANRSQTRRFMREVEARERFPSVPAPPDAVRALIARSVARQPADRPLPRGLPAWRAHLYDVPADAPTPGDLIRAELGDETTPALVREAVELVRKGELGPWPPPPDQLREVAERVRDVGKGRIIVSKVQERDKAERAIETAIETVYDADAAARLAQRLRESAFVLARRAREAEARACLAAARELDERPPAESPIVRALLEVALAPVLEALRRGEQEEEDSSLLVKP